MTIPLWCLVAGIFLPYLWAGVSVPLRARQLGTVDLEQPRLQAAELTGSGAGAWGAQMNQWEAIAVFTAVTMLAYIAGVDAAGSWATASVIWLAARVFHGIFYVFGKSRLRGVSFITSLGMSIWIVVMAAIV
ncbi:MAG: hypothetical protein GXP16_01300 [Gammaproteobacteria bacterium]|nr:hypothetical protein [Gammaproteobacteria bacterium]